MTGNATLFSRSFNVKNFKEIIEKNKGYFFDEESLSGGIDSGNGNIYFYTAKESIINEHSVHFEISKKNNDSNSIMCKLIYSIYQEFNEVELKANFFLVFDSNNFIKEYNKVIKLEPDYNKTIIIFCESDVTRHEIKKIILDSEINISVIDENIRTIIETAYFFVENIDKKKEYFTLILSTTIIDLQLINIFLEMYKKYNILIGFLDDYQLSSMELERFENQIVKFY
ncbi:hypothetical protein VB264_18720 [Arcicella aquatica]|uniref:Uncharacterized protein n=1 Tax=Arcicella aquatica TaxID=217141 RepID=A0ABU5QRX5_9BACT|nr:hypothetical protein [Arcicella aquatica]MEA5259838.1 hypothetical protein [Arcicella aquatica]